MISWSPSVVLDIDVDPQLIVIAILAVVYGIAAVINFIRRMARAARQRLERAAEGRQPIPPPVARPLTTPSPVKPATTPAAPPSAEGRDLMSDLETILRDQLGLDIRPATKRPDAPAAPTATQPPAAPPRPMPPAAPRSRRPAAPAPPRPVAPVRPAPLAMPAQAPPAPVVENVDVHFPAPSGAQAMTASSRAAPPDARRTHAIVSRRAVPVRAMLSGGRLRDAIVLREILGPPRGDRPWAQGLGDV